MFGILIFGILGLWALLSIYLAVRWFARPLVNSLARHLSAGAKFLAVGVITLPSAGALFILPALDEIIAKPQIDALCAKAGKFEYDPKVAFGKTVHHSGAPIEYLKIFPNIQVAIQRFSYLEDGSNQPVLTYYKVTPSGGVFGFPDAGGNKNPWLFKECGLRMTPDEVKIFFDEQHITSSDRIQSKQRRQMK